MMQLDAANSARALTALSGRAWARAWRDANRARFDALDAEGQFSDSHERHPHLLGGRAA